MFVQHIPTELRKLADLIENNGGVAFVLVGVMYSASGPHMADQACVGFTQIPMDANQFHYMSKGFAASLADMPRVRTIDDLPFDGKAD